MNISYSQLTSGDEMLLRSLIELFGDVFEMKSEYDSLKISDQYVQQFLMNPNHIVIIAQDSDSKIVVGGLVAYLLPKFEQARSEIYIYDLGVATEYHRNGIGTTLITKLREVARDLGAYVIFVQADDDDTRAIEFYKSLPITEHIHPHHFDIRVEEEKTV